MHGKGVLNSNDGTKYVGEFINGLASGQGTYTYSDGSVYVGQFKKGKEHGIGTFRCWNHGSKYIGEFKNGKKHGVQKNWYDNSQKELQGEYEAVSYTHLTLPTKRIV